MKIIGLHGLARSGKDTLASYLVEHHGFVRIGLADPLRQFVSDITGIPLEELMDGPAKETPLEWLNQKSPRVLMQTLGTEWGRNMIDEEMWLKVAAQAIRRARQAGAPGVVVPDIRFDNEATFVKLLGGEVFKVVRDCAVPVSAHVSEAGVDPQLIDGVVDNNGPLSALAHAAQQLAI